MPNLNGSQEDEQRGKTHRSADEHRQQQHSGGLAIRRHLQQEAPISLPRASREASEEQDPKPRMAKRQLAHERREGLYNYQDK